MSNENKQTENVTFEIGDIVSFGGVEGVVTDVNAGVNYKIRVEFRGTDTRLFTLDGRYHDWHTEPLLKLVRKVNKKVKKYKVLMQRGFDFVVSSGEYKSEEDFNHYNPNTKFIQLIKESEIEVEE